MEYMAVEISLMFGRWWCRLKVWWSSWTFLWLIGAGVRDDGLRTGHRMPRDHVVEVHWFWSA